MEILERLLLGFFRTSMCVFRPFFDISPLSVTWRPSIKRRKRECFQLSVRPRESRRRLRACEQEMISYVERREMLFAKAQKMYKNAKRKTIVQYDMTRNSFSFS